MMENDDSMKGEMNSFPPALKERLQYETLAEYLQLLESFSQRGKSMFTDEGRRRAGLDMLTAIPDYVVQLDTGEGIVVSRNPESINRIPERERRAWGLQHIAQYMNILEQRVNISQNNQFHSPRPNRFRPF